MRRTYFSFFLIMIILFVSNFDVAAGGDAEAAASSTHGKYLAGQGIIIPPQDIHINSYIAKINYNYPIPEEELGITMYSGHYQVSTGGQEELVHIGIQGKEIAFENLTPLNIAFVIDKSGSMDERDKIGWVQDALDIFIEQVRPIDYVSLVVFDSTAKIVFPSTQMNSNLKRENFKRSVHSIDAGGGTHLFAGLELGYQQVLANFRNEYTNRVLFLTDGVGESGGILEMAESYKEIGINVSTIGVGTDYDVDLMVALSKRGGGSSRFISDRKEMEETFGSELDRMVVPGARNLKMSLEFPDGVEVLGTWGYNNQVTGNKIKYFQPTMHMGDYETILAHIRIPPQRSAGRRELARFTCVYTTLEGETLTSGPHVLNVEFVDADNPVTGFSSGKVLQSGTMLHLAENLVRIGEIYYSIDSYNESTISSQLKQALDLTVATKKEVNNARVRLDNTGFDDELAILDHYIQILGGDLELSYDNVDRYKRDQEIAPPVPKRSLEDHLTRLFKEMTLDLSRQKPGVVAVSGFSRKDGKKMPLLDILDEMAVTEITKLDTLTVVERSNLEKVIDEQKLALTALMDTTTAIEIGKLLTANYIVTGSVIEMPNSVVIFGRIINVETSEVESVAQVIVPKEVIQSL